MDSQYRMCSDCKHPVLASTFHEHLKTHIHREKRMESRVNCGVNLSQIPVAATKEVLMSELQRYGRVRSCSINPYSGTGTVDFEHREAAEALLRSPVFVLGRRIHTSPRIDLQQKRIISPEPGIDHAAIIAALEKVCKSGTADIGEQIATVLDFVMMREVERDQQLAVIVQDLEDHLSQPLPDCRAVLFGSAMTGLSLKGDPIDISICDGPNRVTVSQFRKKDCAICVCKVLLNFQHKFASIDEVPDEREPAIRFIHNFTRIACNLVINNIAGPRASRHIRCVLDLDPRIRRVVMFVKYWAKRANLISNTMFSGYTITMLVFFYLQQISEAMVPAIRLLHDRNIPQMALNISNEDSVSRLVTGFFRFYTYIRFGHAVLSPYLGEILDREIFLQVRSAIPPEMILYKKMLLDGCRPLNVDTPMVLQDPYELNVNVTSRIDVKTVSEFQKHCKDAYEIIKNGSLLGLLKEQCAPAGSSPEVNTTFRAARFLQPKYLVPEPNNEIVLTKKELFYRWLNVMFVILPDFLINFVRLQVEDEKVPVVQDNWEPRAKVARLSERGNASSRNAADDSDINESMTKRWLCSGRPVVCSWQQRKKAAVELELTPSLHPVEREVLISKHLEQSFQSGEVTFAVILKVDEDKEWVRCFFENLDDKPEPFATVAHALVILLPLWINNAFEVGFSLRCVTGVYVPGDMNIGASQNSGIQ